MDEQDKRIMKEMGISKEEFDKRNKQFKPLSRLVKNISELKDGVEKTSIINTVVATMFTLLHEHEAIGLCEKMKFDLLSGKFKSDMSAVNRRYEEMRNPKKPQNYMG